MRYGYGTSLADGVEAGDQAGLSVRQGAVSLGLRVSFARRDDAEAVPPTVFVVDADPSVRDELKSLIEQSGWSAKCFASATSFLAQPPARGPCCLILELTPPDLCGLEVQRRIAASQLGMPLIFITDRRDLRMMVQAMKGGAIELLPKPVERVALLEAVRRALDVSREALAQAAECQALQTRYASLSGREREVMALVVVGLLNKQVGGELGISEITVKAHRGQVMRKMHARTFVDLVHMSAKLRGATSRSPEGAPFPGTSNWRGRGALRPLASDATRNPERV